MELADHNQSFNSNQNLIKYLTMKDFTNVLGVENVETGW